MSSLAARFSQMALIALIALIEPLAGGMAHAQQTPPDFSKIEVKTTQLAPDFYTLEGLGGTVSVLTERLERPSLRADGTPGKPAPALALPVVTYDGPVSIHLNGEDVRLLPIRNAHTDGDTLISFSNHDILAVGDYYRGIGYPYVDLKSGGSLAGILDGLGATIGRAGPNTKIIPWHGPVTDRNAVIAQRDMILTVRDKIAALLAQNKSLEEIVAAKPTADFDAQTPRGAQTAEEFVTWVYEALRHESR